MTLSCKEVVDSTTKQQVIQEKKLHCIKNFKSLNNMGETICKNVYDYLYPKYKEPLTPHEKATTEKSDEKSEYIPSQKSC